MNAGIDYGLGRSNVDQVTGIRYGVISQGSVGQAWYDESEGDYGEPSCPKCGGLAAEYDQALHGENYETGKGCADWACELCNYVFDGSEAYPEEANNYFFKSDEYELVSCLDSDIMVLKSPYFTLAQFCSPCVPGAGNLDSPMEDGVKTLCLGHDWFEDNKAPYPVFNVATGEEVKCPV